MTRTTTEMPERVATAIAEVIVARAKWGTVDDIDRETKNEILKEHDFRDEDTSERITDQIDDFMMTEADFMKYRELVYARNCEKGFDSGSAELNFWPVHKAVYDAEDALVDAIAADIPDYTPEVVKTVKGSPKLRDKFFATLGL